MTVVLGSQGAHAVKLLLVRRCHGDDCVLGAEIVACLLLIISGLLIVLAVILLRVCVKLI